MVAVWLFVFCFASEQTTSAIADLHTRKTTRNTLPTGSMVGSSVRQEGEEALLLQGSHNVGYTNSNDTKSSSHGGLHQARRACCVTGRSLVTVMGFLACVLQCCSRGIIPLVVIPMAREFSWDTPTVGLVLGAFGVGYAPMQVQDSPMHTNQPAGSHSTVSIDCSHCCSYHLATWRCELAANDRFCTACP